MLESKIAAFPKIEVYRGILLLAGALYLSFTTAQFSSFQVGAFADDARYIVVAKSLAIGHGFSLINYPIPVQEILFPPGYPLMLSVLLRIWPDSFAPLQFLSLTATVGTMVVLWYLGRHFLRSRITASLVVLLFAVHPWVTGSATMVMSESVFTFLSLVALAFGWKAGIQREHSHLYVLCCALFVVAATSVRSVGVALASAVFVYLVSRRHWVLAVTFIVVCAALYSPLWIRNAELGGGLISTGYQGFLPGGSTRDEISKSVTNLVEYAGFALPAFVLPMPGMHEEIPATLGPIDLASVVVGGMLLFLGGMAMARKARDGWFLIIAYVLIYMLVLMLYRHQVPELAATTRYLLPLLPLFLIIGAKAFEEIIADSRLRKCPQISIGMLIMAIVLLYIGRDIQAWLHPIRNRIPDLEIGADWIAENTSMDAVIATPDPIPTFLYAQRKTVPISGASRAQFLQHLVANMTDYVLLKPDLQAGTRKELSSQAHLVWLPSILQCSQAFRSVFEDVDANVIIYSVNRSLITTHCLDASAE